MVYPTLFLNRVTPEIGILTPLYASALQRPVARNSRRALSLHVIQFAIGRGDDGVVDRCDGLGVLYSVGWKNETANWHGTRMMWNLLLKYEVGLTIVVLSMLRSRPYRPVEGYVATGRLSSGHQGAPLRLWVILRWVLARFPITLPPVTRPSPFSC